MSQGTLTAKIRTALLAGALMLAGCKPMPITLDSEEWVCTHMVHGDRKPECDQWSRKDNLPICPFGMVCWK